MLAYRVFMNGERARVWNSVEKRIPGLFASVTNVTKSNRESPGYISAIGVPEIAWQPVNYQHVSSVDTCQYWVSIWRLMNDRTLDGNSLRRLPRAIG